MSDVSGANVRALRHALAGAADTKIIQIATLADAMADRATARQILEPIRGRLRPLRPERKMRLDRLLVTPLQAVLVDASDWQDGAVTLPRSAIQPLCAVVTAHLPELVTRVEEMIAGVTTRDVFAIGEAGAVLWPQAAAALIAAETPPPAWEGARLPAKTFRPTAQAVGACLAQAVALEGFGDPTLGVADLDVKLGAALRHAATIGPICWGMMLTLLVCRVPHASLPRGILMNQSAGTVRREAANAALEHVWAWIEEAAEGSPVDLGEAAGALQERAVLLAAVSGEKAWRKRAGGLQAQLRQSYSEHLVEATRERLVMPIATLAESPEDAAMTRLEQIARGLRRLALAVRLLGPAPTVDRALREAADAVWGCASLAPVDRARLIELLDEPEAAMRVPIA
jgi:hypothetical protein